MKRARVQGKGGAAFAWGVAAMTLAATTCGAACGLADRSKGPDSGVIIVPGDDQGFDPDATGDSGGPDGSPDAPETSADATADPLDITADLRALACASFCTDAGGACGFGAIGASQQGCEAACGALATEDAWWLANYTCYSDSCDAARCALDGPPLQGDSGCDAVCAALDACDALASLDLPEDQPDLCRAACAGNTAANPAAADAYACILDALGPTCATDGLAACTATAPDSLCATFCARAYDPALDSYCAPETALRALWPTAPSCVSACASAGTDPAAAYRFAGCMDARGCGDLSPCAALPTTDPPACAAACAAIVSLCGSFGGLGDPALCTPYCAGRLSPYPAGPNPDAAACIAANTCPATADERGALWFRCLLPDDPNCDAMCARLDACKASFDPAFDAAGCVSGCVVGYFGPPDRVAAFAPCTAAEPCASVVSCFPPGPGDGDPLCQPLCAQQHDTCGVPFDPKCDAKCVAAFATGAEAYAESACRLVRACDAQAACDPLAAAPIPAACVDACAASPLSCGGSAARCQGTCAGLLAGLPLAPADAPCVVTALAFACDPTAAVAACPTGP